MDTEATAREILAANRYMVLGTAGADGVPWVSPVWFASDDGETFLWISKPGTRHSRNIAARPARYLLACTPGGFERYFAKLAAEAAGVAPPPEVAKGYPETTVVGPPIGDR